MSKLLTRHLNNPLEFRKTESYNQKLHSTIRFCIEININIQSQGLHRWWREVWWNSHGYGWGFETPCFL